MHVEIMVVAKDYDSGKKATRSEEIEVPARVLKMFEMFADGDEGLLRWVSDTIFGAAVKEVQGSGRRNINNALVESSGGRVGGRGESDKLGETLGLDIIRADVKKNQQVALPVPSVANQGSPSIGPGPVGFGKPTQQQKIGPGPVGFGNSRPINPGPGPGPIGFGTNRGK